MSTSLTKETQISAYVPNDVLSHLIPFLSQSISQRLSLTCSFAYNHFVLEHLLSIDITKESLPYFASRAHRLKRLERLHLDLTYNQPTSDIQNIFTQVFPHLKALRFAGMIQDHDGIFNLLNPAVLESLELVDYEGDELKEFLQRDLPRLRHLAIGIQGDDASILEVLKESGKILSTLELLISADGQRDYQNIINTLIGLNRSSAGPERVILWQDANAVDFDEGVIRFTDCVDEKLHHTNLEDVPSLFAQGFGLPVERVTFLANGASRTLFEIFWDGFRRPITASLEGFRSFFELCHARDSPQRRAEALLLAITSPIILEKATHHNEIILKWVHSEIIAVESFSSPNVAVALIQQLHHTTLSDIKQVWSEKLMQSLADEQSVSEFVGDEKSVFKQPWSQQPYWIHSLLNDVAWCERTAFVPQLCQNLMQSQHMELSLLQAIYNHPLFDPAFKIDSKTPGLLNWVFKLSSRAFLRRDGLEFVIKLMTKIKELGMQDWGMGSIPGPSAYCFDDPELGFQALELFSQIFRALVPLSDFAWLVWKARRSFEPLIQMIENYISRVGYRDPDQMRERVRQSIWKIVCEPDNTGLVLWGNGDNHTLVQDVDQQWESMFASAAEHALPLNGLDALLGRALKRRAGVVWEAEGKPELFQSFIEKYIKN